MRLVRELGTLKIRPKVLNQRSTANTKNLGRFSDAAHFEDEAVYEFPMLPPETRGHPSDAYSRRAKNLWRWPGV